MLYDIYSYSSCFLPKATLFQIEVLSYIRSKLVGPHFCNWISNESSSFGFKNQQNIQEIQTIQTEQFESKLRGPEMLLFIKN